MTRKRAVKLLMSYGYDRNTATRALDEKQRWVPNKEVAEHGRLVCCLAKFSALYCAASFAERRMMIQSVQELASSIRLEANHDQPSD